MDRYIIHFTAPVKPDLLRPVEVARGALAGCPTVQNILYRARSTGGWVFDGTSLAALIRDEFFVEAIVVVSTDPAVADEISQLLVSIGVSKPSTKDPPTHNWREMNSDHKDARLVDTKQ